MKQWGAAILAGAFIGTVAACSNEGSGQSPVAATVTSDGSVAAAQQGEGLDRTQAAAFEKQLQASPGNLNVREQLVGFYYSAQALIAARAGQPADPAAPVVARDRHLLWLIQNSPQLELLGTDPLGLVQPAPDAAGYSAAAAAWSHQAGAQASAQVKGNAGIFFAQTNDARAVDLLKAAEAGDGKNAVWPGALGDLYILRARSAVFGSPAAQEAAALGVEELERAWTLDGSSNRDPTLSRLAKLAVVAGQNDKAVQYAVVLLNTFRPAAGQNPLSIGGPIHDGNMVLGQVALRKGDRSGAERYLLAAGGTPGSPVLDRYGPNFSLARDLLMAGSVGVVLKYCDEVAKFWGDPKLPAWRAAISAGKIPDFGDNLWN